MNILDTLLKKLGNRFPAKEFVILDLLMQQEEMYGLQMVTASPHLKRGTVYVTLSRMQDKGLVTAREGETPEGETGPTRKLYRITADGTSTYDAWRQFAMAMGAA